MTIKLTEGATKGPFLEAQCGILSHFRAAFATNPAKK